MARRVSPYSEGYISICVLLVLAIFVTLYGCGRVGAQNGHPAKNVGEL